MPEVQWLWELNIPKRNTGIKRKSALRSFSLYARFHFELKPTSGVLNCHELWGICCDQCTTSPYTVTRDLARLISQVTINFWSRPGTQLVITTLTVKSGRTRSHITSKEETRRVWLSVITCWRITMAWRKWSTLYQKIMSCYRSVYTKINYLTIRVPLNFKLLCL